MCRESQAKTRVAFQAETQAKMLFTELLPEGRAAGQAGGQAPQDGLLTVQCSESVSRNFVSFSREFKLMS